jgi:hypothetical protein
MPAPPPAPWQRIKEQPVAIILALVVAGMNLYASFGGTLTPEQRDAVQSFAMLATPVVIAGGAWIWNLVSPVTKTKRLAEEAEAEAGAAAMLRRMGAR